MNILLAEYAVSHDPALAPEGRAMLDILTSSFLKSGHTVHSPTEGKDFNEEIIRLGKLCDEGLVIAPDHLLARYNKQLEDVTRNIGCNSFSAAICANKKRTGQILLSHGIDVPREVFSGKRIVKQISGCGTVGVRLTEDPAREGEFGQEFIDGEHLSISLVGSRVVGESCLYYTGDTPLLLALNRQDIRFSPDGLVSYHGGKTPVDHPRMKEIYESASKAVMVLGCQGYVGIDIIVNSDRIVIVDVNPRPTTSIVGIAACMEEEIGQIIIDASYGKAPASVHLKGHAKFSSDGTVTYDRS
ncbi:MAG: ATP-grasp domain-containing protein [Methanomicrobiales archaeon]|nr:ATP-grasp domain-containing protein [Methanomicrobiales archaeon]